MKKLILIPVMCLLSFAALAVDYNTTFSWTDPTPTGPDYTPSYSAKYRVNGGAETVTTGLPTPAWNGIVSANVGDNIEFTAQAVNTNGEIAGPWMAAWVGTVGPNGCVVPLEQTGATIVIQHPACP